MMELMVSSASSELGGMTFSEMVLLRRSLDGHCPESDAAAIGNFYLLSSFITHVSPPKARKGNPHRRRRHEDGGDAGGVSCLHKLNEVVQLASDFSSYQPSLPGTESGGLKRKMRASKCPLFLPRQFDCVCVADGFDL